MQQLGTRDPPGPLAPKVGLKVASLTAAQSDTDPFFSFDGNIGKFPINVWTPFCSQKKIRRSSKVGHHFYVALPGDRCPLGIRSPHHLLSSHTHPLYSSPLPAGQQDFGLQPPP